MISTRESTEFEPFVTMDASHTYGGGLSYVADQPFLVRTNRSSNYFYAQNTLELVLFNSYSITRMSYPDPPLNMFVH